jgi:hypothetical protein
VINEVNGVNMFPLHDSASGFRFQNSRWRLNFPLRELSPVAPAVAPRIRCSSIVSDWEDFVSPANADAYNSNLRWLANRPVDRNHHPRRDRRWGSRSCPNRRMDWAITWGTVRRGGQSLPTAKDFIDHATQENYANWYYGQPGREEGLEPVIFDIRPGAPLSTKFGTIGVDGIANDTWNTVNSILDPYSGQGILGRAALHSGMFITAFHDQSNENLSKFSTGDYIYPDTD